MLANLVDYRHNKSKRRKRISVQSVPVHWHCIYHQSFLVWDRRHNFLLRRVANRLLSSLKHWYEELFGLESKLHETAVLPVWDGLPIRKGSHPWKDCVCWDVFQCYTRDETSLLSHYSKCFLIGALRRMEYSKGSTWGFHCANSHLKWT